MSKCPFKRETELAAVVVEWLRERGWSVWQEVDGFYDIVAVKDATVWSIETKLVFGSQVLAQAYRRSQTGQVHFASVAVPPGPSDRSVGVFLQRAAKETGIGLLRVDMDPFRAEPLVKEQQRPRMHRDPRYAPKLIAKLATMPQDYAEAGTNEGGYWTRFKQFSIDLAAYVGAHPRCTVRDAIKGIRHHYCSDASARARTTQLAEQGVLVPVVLDRSVVPPVLVLREEET